MGGEKNNNGDAAVTTGASAVTETMMSGTIPEESASDHAVSLPTRNDDENSGQNMPSGNISSKISNDDTTSEEYDHDDSMGSKGEKKEGGGGKGKEYPPSSLSQKSFNAAEDEDNEKIPSSPTERVKRSVDRLKRSSSSAYEGSFLCCPIRFIGRFPLEWPRTSAIVFGVVVPLWILIFYSAAFGILLAKFEHENEIRVNDEILANRTVLDNVTSVEDLFYRTLPSKCFEDYFFARNKRPFANNNNGSSSVLVDIDNLLNYVQNCSDTYAREGIEYASDIWRNATSSGTAFESLTFNWNRCWPEELRRDDFAGTKFVFYPNNVTVNASRPSSQTETYERYWHESQQELYEQYLSEFPPNATEEEKFQGAFLRSVREATGSESCLLNVGGTAWFFFTVMTTVGYGNQAPETEAGRLLIYTAGLVSLVMFGAVLAGSGLICTAIFDDMVSRFRWTSFLNNPWVGIVMWGGIWLLYAFAIATDAAWWWERRLGDGVDKFDFTPQDAIWFAFISTSTVGLGDFYFQPEVMFGSDAMRFSIQFLVGFVFLANFLSKIKDAIESLLPTKKKYTLEGRLARTRILACWNRGTVLKYFRRQMGEEVESRTPEEKLELEELKDEAKTLKPKILQERVDELRTFLTEEQQEKAEEESETEEEEEAEVEAEAPENPIEAAVAAVADIFGGGDDEELSEEELALKLVQEEEAILRDLLLLVEEKHQRLRLQSEQDSNPSREEGDEEEGGMLEQNEESPIHTDIRNDADYPSVKMQESEEQEA